MRSYKNPGEIQFKAKIIDAGSGGAYVEFPFDVEELYGVKGRVPVRVIFDKKVEYRGSMVRMGTKCHLVLILKSIREELGKIPGDFIEVAVFLDQSERIVEVPDDITKVFSQNPKLKQKFENLAYTHKREYINWITDAKKPETRIKRIDKLLVILKDL